MRETDLPLYRDAKPASAIGAERQPLFDSSAVATWGRARRLVPHHAAAARARRWLAGAQQFVGGARGRKLFRVAVSAEIYLGTERARADVPAAHWINERLKTIALGVQVLVGLGIIFAYFYRR